MEVKDTDSYNLSVKSCINEERRVNKDLNQIKFTEDEEILPELQTGVTNNDFLSCSKATHQAFSFKDNSLCQEDPSSQDCLYNEAVYTLRNNIKDAEESCYQAMYDLKPDLVDYKNTMADLSSQKKSEIDKIYESTTISQLIDFDNTVSSFCVGESLLDLISSSFNFKIENQLFIDQDEGFSLSQDSCTSEETPQWTFPGSPGSEDIDYTYDSDDNYDNYDSYDSYDSYDDTGSDKDEEETDTDPNDLNDPNILSSYFDTDCIDPNNWGTQLCSNICDDPNAFDDLNVYADTCENDSTTAKRSSGNFLKRGSMGLMIGGGLMALYNIKQIVSRIDTYNKALENGQKKYLAEVSAAQAINEKKLKGPSEFQPIKINAQEIVRKNNEKIKIDMELYKNLNAFQRNSVNDQLKNLAIEGVNFDELVKENIGKYEDVEVFENAKNKSVPELNIKKTTFDPRTWFTKNSFAVKNVSVPPTRSFFSSSKSSSLLGSELGQANTSNKRLDFEDVNTKQRGGYAGLAIGGAMILLGASAQLGIYLTSEEKIEHEKTTAMKKTLNQFYLKSTPYKQLISCYSKNLADLFYNKERNFQDSKYLDDNGNILSELFVWSQDEKDFEDCVTEYMSTRECQMCLSSSFNLSPVCLEEDFITSCDEILGN